MIKLCKGLYIHFSVIIVFLIAYFSKMLEVTAMAFITAFCHELCHLLTALLLKEKCRGIAVMPYGCRLYMTATSSAAKEFLIASAGPLFNVISLLFIKEGPLYDINLAMAVINLFPILPLDGGRMIYAVLSFVTGPFNATSFMKRISFSGGAFLTLLGVYQGILKGFNLSVFTAGTFLLFSAIFENGKERLYMENLISEKKLSATAKKCRVIAAAESLPLRKVLSFISPGDYAVIKIIGGDGSVKKEMTEDEIKEHIMSRGAGVRFREIS